MIGIIDMIPREKLAAQLAVALQRSPAVAILGPRQCGKTTLARQIAVGKETTFLDLEDPAIDGMLQNPALVLRPLTGLVVVDEIQRRPDLFPLLRVLLDRDPLPARFLLLGSASPHILRQTSESLAGRIEFIELSGFDLEETDPANQSRLWLRGGFPRSFLASDDSASAVWRTDFIRTFIERDLGLLDFDFNLGTVRRFIYMLAHCHAQRWNCSELARSLQVSRPTVDRYLNVLSGAFLVRQLQPWFENMGKRIVKSPKVYIRDSGIFHRLMDIETMAALQLNPKLGASWEGFALEHILRYLPGVTPYYWATQGGAELDLLVQTGDKRLGFEFKCADSAVTTKSMHISIQDLRLDHLYVIHPGEHVYPLTDRISAHSLTDFVVNIRPTLL